MYAHIHGNLFRQLQGFKLLCSLLNEEFEGLTARHLDDVATLEFSIHELMRQLFVERQKLGKVLNGIRVSQYAEMLPEEQRMEIMELVRELDRVEQQCARQSTLNAELVFALLDQGQRLLDFMHSRIVPPKAGLYGTKGVVLHPRPEAAVISGRL